MADNLSKYHETSTSEQRKANAIKGGKASVESKKEKKLLKEYLEILLEKKTKTGNVATDMCLALIEKALSGDTRAFEAVRDSIGEKPTDKVEVAANDTIKINITGDE